MTTYNIRLPTFDIYEPNVLYGGPIGAFNSLVLYVLTDNGQAIRKYEDQDLCSMIQFPVL